MMVSQYETRISKNNLDQITKRKLTPSELIDFLEDGALYRSFSDVLKESYAANDLPEKLRVGLSEIDGRECTKAEAETIRKNVANWLNGKSVPKTREQLFKICFALELGEAQTNKVLASASETGIHYRNPRELVYAFALRSGLSYAEAVNLEREMQEIYQPIVDAAEAERQAMWKKKEKIYRAKRQEAKLQRQIRQNQGGWSEPYLGAMEEEEVPQFLTQQVTHRFEKVTDKEGLRRFFLEASADLGYIHESAYEKFWHLLRILQEPDDAIDSTQEDELDRQEEEADAEEKTQNSSGVYSLEQIAKTYFRMNVPVGKKTKNYDFLQKAIKKNWPGATELQKMKNRTRDVSRKALLLLFLITEDFLFSEDLQYSDQSEEDAAWFLPEEEDSPRDQLEIVFSKINLFLETYGMNQLDPGNPFDCLVIYALAAEYGPEFLSDKFSDTLKVLFSRVEEAQ